MPSDVCYLWNGLRGAEKGSLKLVIGSCILAWTFKRSSLLRTHTHTRTYTSLRIQLQANAYKSVLPARRSHCAAPEKCAHLDKEYDLISAWCSSAKNCQTFPQNKKKKSSGGFLYFLYFFFFFLQGKTWFWDVISQFYSYLMQNVALWVSVG